MKILFLDQELTFSIVPRIYANDFALTLKNKSTNTEITPEITQENFKDYVNITIIDQPTDFKIGNIYEISVKSGVNLVYLGQLKVLEVGTNIQNYEGIAKYI